MRTPGAKTLRRMIWQLRGRLFGGDLVLGYHRVADVEDDPWNLSVSPEAFREQMRVLSREFRPTTLAEITAPTSDRSPGLRVAVTFDDGYADVLHRGLPILEEAEIPATVFVVQEGMSGSFWWDRLSGLLRDPARLPEEFRRDEGPVDVHWTREQGPGVLYRSLYRALRQVTTEERDQVLRELERSVGADSESVPAVLTHEEVVEMDRHDLLEIGSHGASHRELRALDGPRLREEISGSAEALRTLLGHPVESFSYPHGILDEQSRRLVGESGYRRACASWNGLVHAGTDPYRLPRLWPSTMAPGRFRSWLKSWTGR